MAEKESIKKSNKDAKNKTAIILPEKQTSTFQSDSPLTPRPFPELVFGLVGPVGVNLDPVILTLSKDLMFMGKGFSLFQFTLREKFGLQLYQSVLVAHNLARQTKQERKRKRL